MSEIPPSARLAWWGTAWLRGDVPPDDLLDAVRGDDVAHTVLGGDGLVELLARARAAGVDGVGAAFPVEGDLVGLGGPPELNHAALEAGEAVIVAGVGLGLVPHRVGPTVEWGVLPARTRPLPDVGEADRGLRAALLETTTALADLDVARWRPEVADRLMNLRHRPSLDAPPGVPPRCVDLVARGLQADDIVAIALEDDGAAVSATEMAARRAALLPLGRAARRALVAGCSPEAWPPA